MLAPEYIVFYEPTLMPTAGSRPADECNTLLWLHYTYCDCSELQTRFKLYVFGKYHRCVDVQILRWSPRTAQHRTREIAPPVIRS